MFKAFYLSFFSKAFYCDIVANWRGIAFTLLFAVVTLHAAIFTIYLYRGYTSFLTHTAPLLVEQIPNITILDGQLRMDKPWPYDIKTKDGEFIVRFDVYFDEAKLLPGRAWVTADKVYIRRSSYDEMRVYSLKRIENFTLDKTFVNGLLYTAKKWFLAVMFPAIVIVFFILRAIQVGIYSIIGLILNKLMGVYLTYPQIVRICVAALVPVLLIDSVLLLVYPVDWPWIGFFLAIGYLIFGLRANRDLIR